MKKLLTIIGLISILLAIGGSIPAVAQDDVPEPPDLIDEPVARAACVTPMKKIIEDEEKAFMEFVDQHFQNELEQSVLFEQAMLRYRAVRNTLNEKLKEFPITGIITENIAGATQCQNMIDESLRRMQFVLKQHTVAMSQGKQGLKITDKYKAINAKLRDLNLDMARLSTNFQSFNNLMPSFTQSCGK